MNTIVAISTQIGISAISIVRLSGEESLPIALNLTRSKKLTPRYAHLKYIYNENNNILDKCIVIYFNKPYSFTGEDVVEFQCHGGIISPKSILEECIKNGARIATNGEFSKRAFLNNKMDISQIEGISKLIFSQNSQIQEIVGRILKGDLKKIIDELRKELLRILAHIEVSIDYQEELEKDLENEIKNQFEKIKTKIKNIYEHSLTFKNVIDGHRLIIIGRPNVGKSSLLNKLLLKERAIISPIEGTTRDVIEESITINNQIIKIADTAGIHNSSDEIESRGIDKTKEYILDSSIIIAVFDGSREFEDEEILSILDSNKEKIIICVINKIDKPLLFDERKLEKFEVIKISTMDSSVYKLREKIGEKIEINSINNQEIILSSNRQIECIKACLSEVENAACNLSSFEISAFHINEALKNLELITRPFNSEEILDSMFSEFCLGK